MLRMFIGILTKLIGNLMKIFGGIIEIGIGIWYRIRLDLVIEKEGYNFSLKISKFQ